MGPEDITPGLLRQLGRDYRCRPYDSRQRVHAQYDDPSYHQHSRTESSFTIRRLRDENQALENELAAARRDASLRSYDLRQEIQGRGAETSFLQRKIQEVTAEFKGVSARYDQLLASKAILTKSLDTLRSETNNITQEKENLEACLVSKDASLRKVQAKFEEERMCIRRDKQQATVCLMSKEAALQECRTQLEEAQQQNSALVKRNADLEAARILLKGSISACWLHRIWIWVACLRRVCARSLTRCRNVMA